MVRASGMIRIRYQLVPSARLRVVGAVSLVALAVVALTYPRVAMAAAALALALGVRAWVRGLSAAARVVTMFGTLAQKLNLIPCAEAAQSQLPPEIYSEECVSTLAREVHVQSPPKSEPVKVASASRTTIRVRGDAQGAIIVGDRGAICLNFLPRKKIVLLGMMARMPVAGVVWQTVQYLVGFQRLGYDAYYVEAHATSPTMFLDSDDHDGSDKVAAFLDRVLRRFDFGDRWAFHALHADGRSYGLSTGQLAHLYDSTRWIINLHGGTLPLPEHCATNRLIFLETDPVEVQIQLSEGDPQTIEFLDRHCGYFTFGENYGRTNCLLPVSDRYDFHPTRQPVVLDFSREGAIPPGTMFTTIGNWRQRQREVVFQGERYTWSKHQEFLKFLDLPCRVDQGFELALSKCEESDREMLRAKAGRCGTRWSFPLISTTIAITSPRLEASSRSPRTRISGSAAAGSVIGARLTWRRVGRWSPRIPASATFFRRVQGCSHSRSSRTPSGPSRRSTLTTRLTAARRLTSRANSSIRMSSSLASWRNLGRLNEP